MKRPWSEAPTPKWDESWRINSTLPGIKPHGQAYREQIAQLKSERDRLAELLSSALVWLEADYLGREDEKDYTNGLLGRIKKALAGVDDQADRPAKAGERT